MKPAERTKPVERKAAASAAPAVRRGREGQGPPRKRVLSIRWIVTGAAVGITAAAVLGVGAVAERNARQALTAELEARLILDARNLALTSSGALLGDFPELTLHPLLKKLNAKQPELAGAIVVDRAGVIQGHPDAQELGTPYAPPEDLALVPSSHGLSRGESLTGNARVLVASAPVTHPDGRVIGTAIVALRRDHLDRVILAARREQSLVLALFLVVGAATAFVLVSQLLKPIGALRQGIERIGSGDLDTPVQLKDRTELGLLAEAVNDMAAELKKAQAEMVERERLTHEMALGRQIQRSLLPSERAVAGSFVVEGHQWAAAEVGGDYYDYFSLPDGRIGVAVADVAGKGLAGCLVMSMVSVLLRALRSSFPSPAALLATLDERLAETLPRGSFVTLCYGVLDPVAGRLTFASAGHNPLLVYRRATGTVERIESRGIPLGAVRGGAIRSTLTDATVEVAPGDMLVQYTDGLSEAFDPSGREQFGLGRMGEVIARKAARGSRAVIEGLRQSVREWTADGPQLDDETLLVVSREGAPAGSDGTCASPGGREDPARDALARLEEARKHGCMLKLPATLDSLVRIREWLQSCPPLSELDGAEPELLDTALYELCANIVEHGYIGDPAQTIELWWVPAPEESEAERLSPGQPPPRADDAGHRVRRGHFLIQDRGVPFHPDRWKETDFRDPNVRKRGRGFGLDIIHRAMRQVLYHPATPAGNITLLRFGPQSGRAEEVETRHV